MYQGNERGIAEPTSVNVNSFIRGFAPLPGEVGYILCEGDIVTVSLGVHVDGYTVLSSQTVHVQSSPSPAVGPVGDAVCALHFAANGIINTLSTGTLAQFQVLVNEAAETFGVAIVQGSVLRRIRRFLIGQSTIEELSSKVLDFTSPTQDFPIEPGEVYVLDLAFSTGTGEVPPLPTFRFPSPKLTLLTFVE